MAKPAPPSVTAMAGAGTRAISAAQAAEHSLRASCQASTCSGLLATSTTTRRPSQMPSRCTTSQTSPVARAMGHIPQNSEVMRLNVALERPMSACVRRDSSQPRNMSSLLAELSILRTDDEPQPGQRHLLRPAPVFPLLLMSLPQSGHLGLSMDGSRH